MKADTTPIRETRAELSAIIAPTDELGIHLANTCGPREVHQWIASGDAKPDAETEHAIEIVFDDTDRVDGWPEVNLLMARWRQTMRKTPTGNELLDRIQALGGGFIVPEDDQWPQGLSDLGDRAPIGLWFRATGGQTDDTYQIAAQRLGPSKDRNVTIVGSREITDYGQRVTSQVASELVAQGYTVISGGAYGADSAFHRAAVRTAVEAGAPHGPGRAPTVAVLAGGLDRLYPAGNDPLLRDVAEHGLVLSEVPVGVAPTRSSVQRSHLIIAAISAATVVTEARRRSTALSIAAEAGALSRPVGAVPVGAVPGSVYSKMSAGTHELIRQGRAQLVTDAAEVIELAAGQP